jgi:hypothetical protein
LGERSGGSLEGKQRKRLRRGLLDISDKKNPLSSFMGCTTISFFQANIGEDFWTTVDVPVQVNRTELAGSVQE